MTAFYGIYSRCVVSGWSWDEEKRFRSTGKSETADGHHYFNAGCGFTPGSRTGQAPRGCFLGAWPEHGSRIQQGFSVLTRKNYESSREVVEAWSLLAGMGESGRPGGLFPGLEPPRTDKSKGHAGTGRGDFLIEELKNFFFINDNFIHLK